MSEDEGPDVSRNIMASIGLSMVLILGVVAVVGWFIRPWLQPIIFAFYTTPELLTGAILALIVTAVLAKGVSPRLVGSFPAIAAILIVLSLMVGGLYAFNTLGHNTLDVSEDRSALPDAEAEHPRIVTRSTAERYASNSLQTSKYKAQGSDITIHNNTTYWSFALAPDGTRNWLLEKQSGTVLVNMEKQGKDVEVVRGEMDVGMGMALTDNYMWNLHKSGPYLVNYRDPFMVVHGGEQFIAVPYTEPKFHTRFAPFPTAYTTPSWGGVALIDQQGNIEHLSPKEARQHPALDGQRLVPFDLTREKVASTSYRNGIVNTLPLFGSHNEQIEVAPVPGEGNDQPFLMRTEEGVKYIVAVEPYGDTQGLREVWVVDARTEEYEVYRSPEGSTLLGPRKAADYVRQAARQTDWDRFNPSEPVPVVVDDTLYWELRVVPTDSSGISYVAFVNAETSDVVGVESTEEVVAFLSGNTDAVEDRTSDGTESSDAAVIIKKQNADGEVVETMKVYENETVVIESTNNSTEAS